VNSPVLPALPLDPSHQPTQLQAMVPALEFVMQARVLIGPSRPIGNMGGTGQKLLVPLLGGDFEGPRLRGEILAGGAEWPLLRPDGIGTIDARYTFQTDDGVLLNIRNTGYRYGPPDVMERLAAKQEIVDPRSYYLRTWTVFEAPDGRYDWLSRHVFIGIGERQQWVLFVRYYMLH